MLSRKLPKAVVDSIARLSKQGDKLAERGKYKEALNKYREAWDLIPEDKENWEASTWLLVATGDLFFQQTDYENALNKFVRAVQAPKGLGNPYIHLRLGQIFFELGDMKKAGDELARAYMGAGEDIFGEDDPKYLVHVRTILRPPEVPKKRNSKKKPK